MAPGDPNFSMAPGGHKYVCESIWWPSSRNNYPKICGHSQRFGLVTRLGDDYAPISKFHDKNLGALMLADHKVSRFALEKTKSR